VKLRGNAQQLNEKYLALAHDAAAAGERITAEAYTQFADHYFRLHQAAVDAAEERRSQHAERQPRSDAPQPVIDDANADGGNADGANADGANADSGNGAVEKDEAAAGNAEVVDLSPAKLSEMVQEEQDSASA
jgi:hypothetical protein